MMRFQYQSHQRRCTAKQLALLTLLACAIAIALPRALAQESSPAPAVVSVSQSSQSSTPASADAKSSPSKPAAVKTSVSTATPQQKGDYAPLPAALPASTAPDTAGTASDQLSSTQAHGPPADAKEPPSQASAETAAQILARIANSGLPERGPHNAPVTIVFFDDFQCPYSAAMYKTLFDNVLKLYADKVKVVIRPLANSSIHPWAKHAAINASCLAAQNHEAYWEYVDYVHNNQGLIGKDAESTLDRLARDIAEGRNLRGDVLQQCLGAQQETVVRQSFEYLLPLNVVAVPTLFIGDEKLQGLRTVEQLAESLEKHLRANDTSRDRTPHGDLSSHFAPQVQREQKDSKENPK